MQRYFAILTAFKSAVYRENVGPAQSDIQVLDTIYIANCRSPRLYLVDETSGIYEFVSTSALFLGYLILTPTSMDLHSG